MADTLTSGVKANVQWTFKEALDFSLSNIINGDLDFNVSLADGTSASQADKVWFKESTLASAASESWDLNALTYSIYGATVTINFAKVSAIMVKNLATGTGEELHVDTTVANGFTKITGGASGKIEVGPNSVAVLSNIVDGWAVTGGSVDVIRMTNVGAGNITYRIAIIGRSA